MSAASRRETWSEPLLVSLPRNSTYVVKFKDDDCWRPVEPKFRAQSLERGKNAEMFLTTVDLSRVSYWIGQVYGHLEV